jgi:hypothetical protein
MPSPSGSFECETQGQMDSSCYEFIYAVYEKDTLKLKIYAKLFYRI